MVISFILSLQQPWWGERRDSISLAFHILDYSQLMISSFVCTRDGEVGVPSDAVGSQLLSSLTNGLADCGRWELESSNRCRSTREAGLHWECQCGSAWFMPTKCHVSWPGFPVLRWAGNAVQPCLGARGHFGSVGSEGWGAMVGTVNLRVLPSGAVSSRNTTAAYCLHIEIYGSWR